MDRANRFDQRSDKANSATRTVRTRRRTAARAAEGAPACGIAVMAKASVPGRTKTRLVPPLTHDQAAALNTAFLQDVTSNMLLAGKYASVAAYAAFGPPGSEEFFERILPPAVGLIPAWLPNFGDCLLHTIEQILERGHTSAVVLNADSPSLPTTLLVETAQVLAQPGERAVLGPSSDGGYYLLGLKTAHRRLFEDISWSTEHVAAQTIERAREIKLDVHMLPAWYDVDEVADLCRLNAEILRFRRARRVGQHDPYHPGQTAALMKRLWPDEDFASVRPDRVQVAGGPA